MKQARRIPEPGAMLEEELHQFLVRSEGMVERSEAFLITGVHLRADAQQLRCELLASLDASHS